jgi:hypothetical protein
VTAQRRTDPRTKQSNRRSSGLKSGAAPSPRRQSAASTATSTAELPLKRGGFVDRRAAADTRPAELSLLERGEHLRDDLLRSNLTHPDPWSYTAKARAWAERAQALVEEIALAGETPALQATVAKLTAEVEGDAGFQKARELF